MFGEHYGSHDCALYYENASGVPWTAAYIQAKHDPIADLYEEAIYMQPIQYLCYSIKRMVLEFPQIG
jgi:hypothetical protein